MRMKRIAGALVAGMVVAGTSQVASAQSSNTEVLAFRGSSAAAGFGTSEGCIDTGVFVVAIETSAPGQPPGKQDSAVVILERRNSCTDEVLLDGSGSSLDVKFDVAPFLRSAELHGVVPVHDEVSDRTLDVAVDVVWTGVGKLETFAEHSSFEDDGVVVRLHDNGSARVATAVLHVVEDTTVLDGEDFNAVLSWSNSGELIINRGA